MPIPPPLLLLQYLSILQCLHILCMAKESSQACLAYHNLRQRETKASPAHQSALHCPWVPGPLQTSKLRLPSAFTPSHLWHNQDKGEHCCPTNLFLMWSWSTNPYLDTKQHSQISQSRCKSGSFLRVTQGSHTSVKRWTHVSIMSLSFSVS